jgi:hypothetical protein
MYSKSQLLRTGTGADPSSSMVFTWSGLPSHLTGQISITVVIIAVILSSVLGPSILPTDHESMALFSYLMLAITFFAYYIVMEAKYQKTLAKFIT